MRKALLIIVLSILSHASTQYLYGQINFVSSDLKNTPGLHTPTSLQFGPDGRLYVAQQDGLIRVYTIKRNASNDYEVTNEEQILLVRRIPNHFDDGSPRPFNQWTNKRQITGILVVGTAENPVLYVGSSDPWIGGPSGDKNLCTNSGVISRLTWDGEKWNKIDIVRGLPRSEENHANNGMQLDEQSNKLFVAVGGFTNAGSPSYNFAFITEYALSACILSIDLNMIEAMPVKGLNTDHPYIYDLPTLDDPTRPNNPDGTDVGDPWGGNDGLNQAIIDPNGPVQVFATGLRNPYDVLITKDRRMYSVDNGANQGWGGHPENEGSDGNVTNNYVPGEPGSLGPSANKPQVNNLDGLHYIGHLDDYTPGSYYGGHPCPIRANPSGAYIYTHDGPNNTGTGIFRTGNDPAYPLPVDWPPVPLHMANPIEGDFQNPGTANSLALLTFNMSTNGLCEYTASNFNGALKGNILAAGFNGPIFRIKLTEDGTDVLNAKGNNRLNQDPVFASGFGEKPLDVTAQGDNDIFPGTVWSAIYGGKKITIFEPDEILCAGNYEESLDEDGDCYSNADELDNNTDPCSAASRPEDFNGNCISNLRDPDDDSDGILDTEDAFAWDASNGKDTYLPLNYSLLNNDPGTGFFGLGFTGLMTNKTTDYLDLYYEEKLIAGGAIGAFSITDVSEGDALGSLNNQEYAFQFGINVSAETGSFTIKSRLLGSFYGGKTPTGEMSQGIYIGNGDQDNYLKIAIHANNGAGGIQIVHENNGIPEVEMYDIEGGIPSTNLDLMFTIDPVQGTVQPRYRKDGGDVYKVGPEIQLTNKILESVQAEPALALGFIATSREGESFQANWDFIDIQPDATETLSQWEIIESSDGSTCTHRHENGFVKSGDKFYLIGGREPKPVDIYDPATQTWSKGQESPIELHHFQAVDYKGKIYIAGAFTGVYPEEPPVPNIFIYDPAKNTWTEGPEIPSDRRRGSAGMVVRNNKIYLINGITNGHTSGHVSWFDEFNPETGEWKILPDAPRARDHFHAALVDDKIIVASGRRSSYPNTFGLTVSEVDVYDFATGQWTTMPNNLPTPRAGATVAVINKEVLIIGGESMAQMNAHNETEALDTETWEWKNLAPLNIGRHGTQAIVHEDGIYLAAGNAMRSGGAEQNNMERYTISQSASISLVSEHTFYDFETLTAGQEKKDTIRLSNPSSSLNIVIQEIELSGTNDSEFYLEDISFPLSIAPGTQIEIILTFSPQSPGKKEASIDIAHSGNNSPLHISIKGEGLSEDSETPTPPSPGLASVKIIQPENGASYQSGQEVTIEAELRNFDKESFSFLEILCPDKGWRKLKLGYHTNQIYNAGYDVTASGNNTMEIEFKDLKGNANWSKIQIRPQGILSAPVSFGDYISVAEHLNNGWMKISIPLSHFHEDADFTAMSKLELPYSVSAGEFKIGLRKVLFSGGTEPFLWFGGDKTDNRHDGNGQGGQLTATLIEGDESPQISKMEFYANDTQIGEALEMPYSMTWLPQEAGEFFIYSIAYLNSDGSIISDSVSVIITGSTESLELSADTLYFEEISKELSIVNTGSSDISILEVNISGTDADAFTHNFSPPQLIPAGETILVEFSYTGAGEGQKEAIAEIHHSSSSSPIILALIRNEGSQEPPPGGGDETNALVRITKPEKGSTFDAPATIELEAEASPKGNGESYKYFKVDCPDGRFRKLKLSYNSGQLYNPQWNVLEGGNTTMELEVKDLDGRADWSKIQVRPQGDAQKLVRLGNYLPQAENLGNGWKKIKIPLSDFHQDLDFTNVSVMEVPYSAGAGEFSVGLRKVEFTGGSNPFLWFGEGKIDNAHDGSGGGGQLLAELLDGSEEAVQVEKVAYFENGELIGEGFTEPFSFQWENVEAGEYHVYAIAYFTDGSMDTSDVRIIKSLAPSAVLAVTPPGLNFQEQKINSSSSPQQITLNNTASTHIEIENILLTGADAGLFSQDATPPFSIAPGNTYTINVIYSPLEEGTNTAILELVHSGTNSPVSIELQGQAIPDSGDPGDEESIVLYRINAGGWELMSNDGIPWRSDHFHEPSPYFNQEEAGNKTWATNESIEKSASVPDYVPSNLFQSERATGNWVVPSLSWDFPVEEGDQVEVRLFFSESFFSSSNQRLFNIRVQDTTRLSDLDLFTSSGKNMGVMHSYRTTSDGNVSIDLDRVKQHPTINGIEIICIMGSCQRPETSRMATGTEGHLKQQFSVYPNPFNDKLFFRYDAQTDNSITYSLYNSMGTEMEKGEVNAFNGREGVQIHTSHYSPGVYFLKIKSSDNKINRTIKLLKQ
ncbi:MAG: choice-of-anchor D domain-containing protein [Cytophagaceae bacterium]